MATCYYNEALEELSGSLESIKDRIDAYLENVVQEQMKKRKDRTYYEKYLDKHLEIHLAVDTCFKDPDRDTIDSKELKIKEENDLRRKKQKIDLEEQELKKKIWCTY